MTTSSAPPLADDALAVVAAALEQLVTRVTLHLDPDAGEGAGIEDPGWAAAHAELVAVARQCSTLLDNQTVIDALLAR